MSGLLPVTLVFFASGAAGLIFEVVWLHRCGLVFGNGIWTTTIVLSSLMGGLALGNALAGWFGAGARRGLRVYAVLETLVALSGLAAAQALPVLSGLIASLAQDRSVGWLNAARLITASGVLVVPTTAMGTTLPILAGALTGRIGFGRTLGWLYGWNTLGAVAGVVAAEVVLVDRVGVAGSAWVAAGLNLLAAAGAWTIADGWAIADRGLAPQRGDSRSQKLPRAALLACAFLAGCALLGLEVIWFRFLTMFVLSTTLAASMMIAAVLAAIGAGSLIASLWLAHDADAARHAPVVAAATCVATALSYGTFQWTALAIQVAAWDHVLWLTVALAAPTSLLSGVLFTLIGDAIGRRAGAPTRAAAWLTAANTIGAMCGPPIAAFVLLPALGVERTIYAATFVYFAIAMLASRASGAGRPLSPVTIGILGAAISMVFVQFPFGLMARRYFPAVVQPYTHDGSEVVATREGPADTILLMQQSWLGKPVYQRLVTNGFSMTGTSIAAMRYMRAFAYWPLMLRQSPVQRALVICYGAGVTARAVLDLPHVTSLDIVELSPDIVAMSDRIEGQGRPLRDPRVRLHVDDGRFFLRATRERYDLITAEPPPPRTPGAVNIYTREYFALVRDRLSDGGVATYWLPVARPDPGTDVNTIVRAFCDVFEDCSLWNATPSDLMLVGTRAATGSISASTLAAAWDAPGLGDHLREVGFEAPQQIGATFLGDAAFLRELTADTPALTDDFPQRLRPVPGRPSLSDPNYRTDPAVLALYRRAIDPDRARGAFAESAFIRRVWSKALIDATLPSFEQQKILNRVMLEGAHPLRQIEDLHATLTTTALRTLPLWLLGSDAVQQAIAAGASERTAETEYAQGIGALAARDYRRAAAHLGESERRGMPGGTVRALQVYALCLSGDLESARQLVRGAIGDGGDEQHFWSWLRISFGLEKRDG
jgi:spermidine synthase